MAALSSLISLARLLPSCGCRLDRVSFSRVLFTEVEARAA